MTNGADPKAKETESGSSPPSNDVEKKIRCAERFGVPVKLSEQENQNSRAERFTFVWTEENQKVRAAFLELSGQGYRLRRCSSSAYSPPLQSIFDLLSGFCLIVKIKDAASLALKQVRSTDQEALSQASRLLKMERNSLEYLLNYFCEVIANKEMQIGDCVLPLEMIRYAREDTHYLLYIYNLMRARVRSLRVWASVTTTEKPSPASEIVLQPIKDIFGTIKLPGSKSLSNRILLAALAERHLVLGLNLIAQIIKESDLHTKRTGHMEFTDKALEAVKPISLEAPKHSDGNDAPMDIDPSSSNQESYYCWCGLVVSSC